MDADGSRSVSELSGAVESKRMTTVYLIRHAEAEGNVYRRCHGQYDSLLTPRAYEQLPCLAKRFRGRVARRGICLRPVPRPHDAKASRKSTG